MDLLKKYGAKELARMTFRELSYRKGKKKIDVDIFLTTRYNWTKSESKK